MTVEQRDLKKQISEALGNESLRTALSRRSAMWLETRKKVFADIDFKTRQAEARAVKECSIKNLPALIERFKEEAAKVGATIYEAHTADDANRYISGLAKTKGVNLAVKSKSMVSEETDLNHHLEAEGIKVVETDVGEWIVQLAHERPSHLLAPAVHKTREQVAELFSKETGKHLDPDDIPAMVEAARDYLRQSFINAGMGITGANVAIAESGTICIITNEGNDRLVSGLPPVHVALVSIDKLVETLEEATTLIKMVSINATSQKLPTYVSFISGPSRTRDIEFTSVIGAHGPKEVHIVLLDNGRSEIAKDPALREALYCVRCGACLYYCPVFRSVGGHVFGDRYVGGIGSVMTALLRGKSEAKDILELCTGCGACNEVCAMGIRTPELIQDLKDEIAASDGVPLVKRLAFKGLLKHPGRMELAAKAGRVAQIIFKGKDDLINMPSLPGLPDHFKFPSLARKPLRDMGLPQSGKKDGPLVALYSGCLIDYVYPETGLSMAEVISDAGMRVILPAGQECCGFPPLHSGDKKTAIEMAKANIEAMERDNPQYIVTGCPTCLEALKVSYPELLKDDPAWSQRAKVMAAKSWEFSQFAADVLKLTVPVGNKEGAEKVTYHDPCHLVRGFEVKNQPRELLESAGGIELVEMKSPDTCCGFAGSYCADFPGISGRILENKIEDIEQTGAGTVVTSCPGCVMHIRGGLGKRQSSIKVRHIADVLSEKKR